MVDTEFLHIKWEEYLAHLTDLFGSGRETVYLEICKESFNVRRVLFKKFNFLTAAYWVFLIGLLYQ